MRTVTKLAMCASLLLTLLVMPGCGSTATSHGASLGALVGGLAGGWEGAAVGALAGGGVGLMADTAEDKRITRQQKEREIRAMERSSISSDPKTAYRPPKNNQLVGSTWRVISYVSDYDPDFDFKSMIVTFQTNTKMTTLTIMEDGEAEASVESYRIVDDAMIITGKDYVINAKFTVEDRQMILVSPVIRIVLEEVEETI